MSEISQQDFNKRVIVATFIVILMVCGFLLIGYATKFFLLIFGSILFAVLLRAGTNFFKHRLKFPDGLGLAVTTLIFFGILAGIFVLIIPSVAEQGAEMRVRIPMAIENIKARLDDYTWGRVILERTEADGIVPDEGAIVRIVADSFSILLSGISDLLILLIIGVFFAASPKLYQQGVIVLAGTQYRNKLEAVSNELYLVLKSWLLGKFLTMLFIGIGTLIALLILDVPMPLALAFLAFLLDFIPTIGPIIAAVPAILVAFLVGPVTALLVAILYFVLQSVESYILVPYIYKRTVAISPVITLASLVLFGILAGPLGIILATPLVAVIQIIIRELYIKSYLESDLPENSENSFESRMKGL